MGRTALACVMLMAATPAGAREKVRTDSRLAVGEPVPPAVAAPRSPAQEIKWRHMFVHACRMAELDRIGELTAKDELQRVEDVRRFERERLYRTLRMLREEIRNKRSLKLPKKLWESVPERYLPYRAEPRRMYEAAIRDAKKNIEQGDAGDLLGDIEDEIHSDAKRDW